MIENMGDARPHDWTARTEDGPQLYLTTPGLGAGDAHLGLTDEAEMALITAARSKAQVVGLTHTLYRYPARFSPEVAKAAIDIFTEPGDLVADCFVGGGTSLVEALAMGRNAIGTDISTLATFISQVKTTLLDDDRLNAIARWAEGVVAAINMRDEAPTFDQWADAGYVVSADRCLPHISKASRFSGLWLHLLYIAATPLIEPER